jgi:energy-converting hydrogenase A subunit R
VAHAFIVSTSYEHYIRTLCEAIGFPYENTYCTRLSLDKFHMANEEKEELEEVAKEITKMPTIEIPLHAKNLDDLAKKDRETIHRLDEIFWKEIACTDCGRILSEIIPVGGSEKANAIKDIMKRTNATLADVMYVGDSITDVEAFKLVRENGGLAVSFNGNQYAIRNADVAIFSDNGIVSAIIADVFGKFGRQGVLSFAESWNREKLSKSSVSPYLLNSLFELYPKELPKVKIITSENMETLAKESSDFRKKLRGEAIGRLG